MIKGHLRVVVGKELVGRRKYRKDNSDFPQFLLEKSIAVPMYRNATEMWRFKTSLFKT